MSGAVATSPGPRHKRQIIYHPIPLRRPRQPTLKCWEGAKCKCDQSRLRNHPNFYSLSLSPSSLPYIYIYLHRDAFKASPSVHLLFISHPFALSLPIYRRPSMRPWPPGLIALRKCTNFWLSILVGTRRPLQCFPLAIVSLLLYFSSSLPALFLCTSTFGPVRAPPKKLSLPLKKANNKTRVGRDWAV